MAQGQRRDLGVGDVVEFGECFAELFFGEEALFDEEFAEQFVAAFGFLLFQHRIQALLVDEPFAQQDLANGLAFGRGGDHVIWRFLFIAWF